MILLNKKKNPAGSCHASCLSLKGSMECVVSRQHCLLCCSGEKKRGFIGVRDTAAGLEVSPGSLSAQWQNRCPVLHCSTRLQEQVPRERCAGME